MDNFIVSARKYRPKKFEDVVGQQSIADTLKKAIKNNRLASAYLFCGPRGVGKTTCARIFAKAINCLNPLPDGEACDECESCVSFNEQRSVNIQELNAAANNSVDGIREIIDQIYIPPQLGRYKVIILDEVHMLSGAASNALLKTLEEPPSYVIFILATTEKHKILPTIQSRCQIFDFNRMEISDIVGNLKMVAAKENIAYEEAGLNIIAQKADGGMRDALSIFDQVSNFSQGNITYESVLQCINALDNEYYFKMTDFLVKHEIVESMLLYNEIVNKGFNGGVFMAGLASHCRDLLMSRDPLTLPLLNVAQSQHQRYTEQAKRCSTKFLYHVIRSFDRCSNNYKTTLNKRLSVEITLIEAAQFSDDDDDSSGRRPTKRLKPLFKQTDKLKAAANQTATTRQPTTNNQTIQTASAAQGVVQTHGVSPLTKPAATTPQQLAPKRPKRLTLAEALQMARTSINAAPKEEKPTIVAGLEPVDNVVESEYDSGEEEFDENSEEAANVALFYSQQQVEAQWKTCSDVVKAHSVSMSQRMLAMPLECKSDHTVVVSLHDESSVKDFTEFIPLIESTLNKIFHLDNIKIETATIPVEIIKVITSPTALLDKMRKDYPDFDTAVKELGMHII